MTYINNTRPADSSIIGPFSHWPRRPMPRRRMAFIAGGAASVGVFLHCIAPMLIIA